jgi:eukaryotic-like serine/threonine-protein kinase
MTQDDPQEAAGVREGQILAGKYGVERVLGIGGVVVAAHHVQLDEKVAIKFPLPAMLHNQEVVGRFAREARAAVKIKSEHVARVSNVGTLENGAPYMVMEYLDGGDLAPWIQQQGPLPIEQAVDFVLQPALGSQAPTASASFTGTGAST